MSADRWVLVPVEPTPEMVRAWRAQSPGGRFHKQAWAAALAAAPAAPAAEPEVDRLRAESAANFLRAREWAERCGAAQAAPAAESPR
jgi:hypothetical protein